MRDKFCRQGKPWMYKEMIQLVELYESGATWTTISYTMMRSLPTCVSRLRSLRYNYKLPEELWQKKSIALTDPKMYIKKRL